jgi:hypothetical protein
MTSTIPTELGSHKLDFRQTITRKRPAPLFETSANRGRYVALFSSPPPPDNDEKDAVPATTSTEPLTEQENMPVQKAKNSFGTTASIPTSFVQNKGFSKPAVTMHETSMSSIGQNGYSMFAGKKTLGIRRTMNGWDARKNK